MVKRTSKKVRVTKLQKLKLQKSKKNVSFEKKYKKQQEVNKKQRQEIAKMKREIAKLKKMKGGQTYEFGMDPAVRKRAQDAKAKLLKLEDL